MAIKTAIIKNWEKGIAPKPRAGGIRDAFGSPIYPFASVDGIDPYRIPGIAMPGLKHEVISDATGENEVVDWIQFMDDHGGNIWALGDAGNIYKIDTSDAVTNEHTSTNIEGRGMCMHHDGTAKYMYYRAAQEIGRFNLAATYNDDYITGLTDQGSGIDAPLVSYINNLYYANGGYIGRKAGGAAGNDTYLQIPANYVCKQIVPYGEWLILNLRRLVGDIDNNVSKIIFWDGIKTDYQETINIQASEITLYNDNNTIRGWLGYKNPAISYLSGRRFVGQRSLSSFMPSDSSTSETTGGTSMLEVGAIVGMKNAMTFGMRSQAGLYTFGSKYPEFPNAIQKPYYIGSNSGYVGALFWRESLERLYTGYWYGSTYKIGRFATGYYSGANFVTPVLDFGTRRLKQIHAIRVYHMVHQAGNSIKLEARKDGEAFAELFTTSFTDNGTVDFKKYDWGLDSIAREFEFKPTMTTTSENDIGIYSIEIDWDYAPEK